MKKIYWIVGGVALVGLLLYLHKTGKFAGQGVCIEDPRNGMFVLSDNHNISCAPR